MDQALIDRLIAGPCTVALLPKPFGTTVTLHALTAQLRDGHLLFVTAAYIDPWDSHDAIHLLPYTSATTLNGDDLFLDSERYDVFLTPYRPESDDAHERTLLAWRLWLRASKRTEAEERDRLQALLTTQPLRD